MLTITTGSIARVGPNDLITSDPDLIKHMYKARGDYTRSSWYEGMRFNPSRDNLLSLRSEAEHTKLRAKMASGVSWLTHTNSPVHVFIHIFIHSPLHPCILISSFNHPIHQFISQYLGLFPPPSLLCAVSHFYAHIRGLTFVQ